MYFVFYSLLSILLIFFQSLFFILQEPDKQTNRVRADVTDTQHTRRAQIVINIFYWPPQRPLTPDPHGQPRAAPPL